MVTELVNLNLYNKMTKAVVCLAKFCQLTLQHRLGHYTSVVVVVPKLVVT